MGSSQRKEIEVEWGILFGDLSPSCPSILDFEEIEEAFVSGVFAFVQGFNRCDNLLLANTYPFRG